MTRKFFAVLIALAFVAGTIGFVSADNDAGKDSTELAVLLPESDMVMTLDSERLLNQALPQILSANQPMLAKVNAGIERIKTKTGLDLREFRQVAVGVRSKQISATETDLEPVALARGTVDAKTLVAAVKLASNGKYRTEKIGDRTVYIFSPKEIIEENKDKISTGGNSVFDKMMEKMSNTLSKEIAVSAYDSNTLVFGMPSRVRETVSNTPRISNEVLILLNRKPDSIINVGAKMQTGLSRFLPLDNDELGRDLDAIRQVQGSMDVGDGNTYLSILTKSAQIEQAESLEFNMRALQKVFSAILKGLKGADKKVYGKTLAGLDISRDADEVRFELTVPQSDIDIIIGKK